MILLLTDGIPEAPVSCSCDPGYVPGLACRSIRTCCPTIPDAVTAATTCLEGDPGISTYVLGVGPALDNLAGHRRRPAAPAEAYLVEGGDVANEVLDALRSDPWRRHPLHDAVADAAGWLRAHPGRGEHHLREPQTCEADLLLLHGDHRSLR